MTPYSVLHVTEAMGGGIVTALERLSRRQVETGASVTILFTRREATPTSAELARIFGPEVSLLEIPTSRWHLGTILTLAKRLRSRSRSGHYDAVHLHSSVAGAVGRVWLLGAYPRRSTFYSPHGFGFLRQDLPSLVIKTLTIAERILNQIGGSLVLVSESEEMVARDKLRARNTVLLRNGVAVDELLGRPPRDWKSNPTPRVAMIGRVTYQKAPWLFAEAANKFGHLAQFVWLGDGPKEAKQKWIGTSPVLVSGWLNRSQLIEELKACDVLYFPTLWEGMPLALMEAQVLGIPAVASDIVGNKDVVQSGYTGYLATGRLELEDRLEYLIKRPATIDEMSLASRLSGLRNLSDVHLGEASLRMYQNAGRTTGKVLG